MLFFLMLCEETACLLLWDCADGQSACIFWECWLKLFQVHCRNLHFSPLLRYSSEHRLELLLCFAGWVDELGQGHAYIYTMRLWWPSWQMVITFEPLTLETCNWYWQKALVILNNFYSRHFSPICSRNRARDMFTFILCAYFGHFENGRHVRQRSNPRWVNIQICS